MNTILKLVVFCLISKLSFGAEIPTEEDVLVLDDSNFQQALDENTFLLVEFYAPWCGHCKALAPEYAKAAGTLKAQESEVKLAKVDATIASELAQKFKVQGYPTLKFFKNGIESEYQGGRTADEIVNWLKKKTGPATVTLDTVEAFTKFTEDNEVCVVSHFTDLDSDKAKIYVAVAESIDDAPFAVITDASLVADENIKLSENGVSMFRSFDEPRIDFDGEHTADAIKAFVAKNLLALVTEFTQETAPKIFGGSIQVHNLLFISRKSDKFQEQLDAFKGAAKEHQGEVLFVFIDSDVEDNGRVLEFFGLKAADVPQYRIIKMADKMAKFKPETNDIETEKVSKFTAGVLSGDIKRHLMSEEVPESQKEDEAYVLVGKAFQEVFDPKKAYFVEFYAPWCGHCKQLAPIWDSLAAKFKDRDDVVIAKMDATANEVDEFEISGFPTLKYFPKEGGEPVMDYNGERTLDAMAKFVESDGKEVVGEDEDEEDIEETPAAHLPQSTREDESLNNLDNIPMPSLEDIPDLAPYMTDDKYMEEQEKIFEEMSKMGAKAADQMAKKLDGVKPPDMSSFGGKAATEKVDAPATSEPPKVTSEELPKKEAATTEKPAAASKPSEILIGKDGKEGEIPDDLDDGQMEEEEPQVEQKDEL